MPRSAPIPSVFRPNQPATSRNDSNSQIRPLTLSELADKASKASKQIPFSNSVPLNRYVAGAESLKQQAKVYQKEKRNEDQFICLVKCARLLVELLPSHHGWHDADENTRKRVRKEGQAALDSLSSLKSAQHDLFEAWRAKNPNVALDQVPTSSSSITPSTSSTPTTTPISSTIESTKLSKNQKEPSIQTLIGQSFNNSQTSSSSPYSSNNPHQTTQSDSGSRAIDFQKADRGSDGLFGFDVRNILGFGAGGGGKTPPISTQTSNSIELPYVSSKSKGYDFDPMSTMSSQFATLGSEGTGTLKYPTLNPTLSIRMTKHQETQGFAPSSNQTARYYQTLNESIPNHQTSREIPFNSDSSRFQMPSAQHFNSTCFDYPSTSSLNANKPPSPTPPHLKPHDPTGFPTAIHQNQNPTSSYSNPYPLPQGVSSSSTLTAPKPQPGSSGTMSGGGSVTSQANLLMGGTLSGVQDEVSIARTESGAPLRTLLIPSTLIEKFVDLAHWNTEANKETCGLLMGHLKNNVLKVTHLLLPQQTSDSDSCTTHSEEDIFYFQDANNLITLGWIHTHPSQSVFLSSLDLHTHASYQSMLPEAVAIVVSPKRDPNFGLFRLTDGPGLQIVLECKDPRSFHPHQDEMGRNQALYTDAIFGHCRLTNERTGRDVEICDLRR